MGANHKFPAIGVAHSISFRQILKAAIEDRPPKLRNLQLLGTHHIEN